MELKIYTPEDQFPKQVKWNYDELKTEITELSQSYAAAVYSDESIKVAKADRAKLNKFVDAITGKRTEIRKQLLAPDERFGNEVKELTGIVQVAIDNIDSQVKDYEDRQRREKTAVIREFYQDNIYDITELLPFERVIKPNYTNASTAMKTIKAEILDLIQKVSEGLAILNEVDSPYASDMKAVFLKEYDIGAALAERNRLEVAEQKRKEYKAQRAAEKEAREAARKVEMAKIHGAGRVEQVPVNPLPGVAGVVKNEPVHMIDLRVHASDAQLKKLKSFLIENGIKFEPVPK